MIVKIERAPNPFALCDNPQPCVNPPEIRIADEDSQTLARFCDTCAENSGLKVGERIIITR